MFILLNSSHNNLYISILNFKSPIYREHKEGPLLSLRAVKILDSFRVLCPVGRANSFLIYSTLLNIKPLHSLLEYSLLCLAKHCFTAQQYYMSSIFVNTVYLLNEMVDAGKVLHTKRNRESFLPQVDRALHLWFCEMRSKPHAPPINQSLLVQKSTL